MSFQLRPQQREHRHGVDLPSKLLLLLLLLRLLDVLIKKLDIFSLRRENERAREDNDDEIPFEHV